MILQSTRFGQIEIPDDQIIQFPQGLPGFSQETSFAFLPHQPESPFAFLQSTRDADLSFLLVDPFKVFSDYNIQLGDDVVEALILSEECPPQVWSIVTIKGNLNEMTTNLLAPVILNWKNQRGAQIILEKTSYTTKHRIFKDVINHKEDSKNPEKVEQNLSGEAK